MYFYFYVVVEFGGSHAVGYSVSLNWVQNLQYPILLVYFALWKIAMFISENKYFMTCFIGVILLAVIFIDFLNIFYL